PRIETGRPNSAPERAGPDIRRSASPHRRGGQDPLALSALAALRPSCGRRRRNSSPREAMKRLFGIPFCLLLALTACGGGEKPSKPQPKDPPIARIAASLQGE